MQNTVAIFPHHMLRAGLSRNELLVLSCLLSYRNGGEQVCPSRATIARDTGIHVSHVHRAVKSLAQKGMITMETQAGVRTVYTFPWVDNYTVQVIGSHATAPRQNEPDRLTAHAIHPPKHRQNCRNMRSGLPQPSRAPLWWQMKYCIAQVNWRQKCL